MRDRLAAREGAHRDRAPAGPRAQSPPPMTLPARAVAIARRAVPEKKLSR